jgi:prephenate dehydratase
VLPKTTAVIASARAAELYSLDILDEKIQDMKFNYTVFVAAKRKSA